MGRGAEGEAVTEEEAVKPLFVKVHRSDVVTEMEENAVDVAKIGLERYPNSYRDAAMFIMKEFDRRYASEGHSSSDGVFHVVCGMSFAASVSHETRAFIHVQVGTTHVIIFKSKDSPFDQD